MIECRCCLNKNLFRYLDLGNQPLANSYHMQEAELPKYPLQMELCQNCFHSQLSIVVPPDEMFKNYLYVSGTTQTFRSHCDALSKDAIEYFKKKHSNKRGVYILDIACNDGTLLECFRKYGCHVQGVDPAENLRKITAEKGISVEVGYWADGKIANRVGKHNIITGTNVFAHVADVDAFLQDCKTALNDEGVVILEFPYCDKIIEYCEFDTIYSEHLSYFLVNSFKALVDRNGFKIDRILQTSIHGGSIRFFLEISNALHCKEVDDLIDQEKNKGLLDLATYQRFGEQVEKNKHDMRALINRLQKDGKKVIGFGASAKGNTMLNYFEIDLDYIVDDNEMKWEFKTPGRNILIKSPQEMANEDELWIVILAWNFYDEIVEKIEKICGKSHHYIRYVPVVSET